MIEGVMGYYGFQFADFSILFSAHLFVGLFFDAKAAKESGIVNCQFVFLCLGRAVFHFAYAGVDPAELYVCFSD